MPFVIGMGAIIGLRLSEREWRMEHEERSKLSMAHNTIKSRSKCSFSPLTAVGGRADSFRARSISEKHAKDLIYTTLTINSSILSSLPEGVIPEYWSPAALIHYNYSNFKPLDTVLDMT